MAWLYVPGLADSNLASALPLASPTAVWVILSGTATQRPCSWRGWKTRLWIRLLSGTISQPSTANAGVESWISSLRASRASHGASQESSAGSKTHVGSGPRSSELFATWNRASSSWKMSLDLFGTAYHESSEIWPNSGSMRNGCVSRRATWERRTSGNDCLFWPTPDAGQYGSTTGPNGERVPLLGQMAKLWPTPGASDTETCNQLTMGKVAVSLYPTPRSGKHGTPGTGERHPGYWPTPNVPNGGRVNPEGTSPTGMTPDGEKKQIGLEEIAKKWATPVAMDYRSDSSTADDRRHSPPLGRQVLKGTGPESKRSLNPLFVEWLMGLPREWTDCDASATESFRSWLRTHSGFLQDDSS